MTIRQQDLLKPYINKNKKKVEVDSPTFKGVRAHIL